MKRYYLSPVVGSGTFDDRYRAKVQDYGVSHVAVIPTDPTTGRPTSTWCLCLVAAADHTALLNDPSIGPLPDYPLDGKVNAIKTGTVQQAQQMLTRFGADASVFASSDGYRDAIRGIGRQLQPTFDENNFDVSDQ